MTVVNENLLDEKEPFGSSLAALFWLGLFGLVIVLLSVSLTTTRYKNHQLKKYALKLTGEIDRLGKEQGVLQKEVSALKDDPFYVEFLMRKELGMSQKGEVVIRKN